jgi:hypothetical protein
MNDYLWKGTRRRTNIADAPRDATGKFLIDPVPSEVLNPGNPLRDLVVAATPPEVGERSHCTANWSLATKWHVDDNLGESWVMFLDGPGGYTGGELELEDGTLLSERGVWHRIPHGVSHRVRDIEGKKLSVVWYDKAPRSPTECCEQ